MIEGEIQLNKVEDTMLYKICKKLELANADENEKEMKLTDEEMAFYPEFKKGIEELVDICIKTKEALAEQDRKSAEERKGIDHRKFCLECKACGSKDIRLSRVIEKDEGETWDDVASYEYYNHDGFGWELDRFDITCAKCGSDKIEIGHEDISAVEYNAQNSIDDSYTQLAKIGKQYSDLFKKYLEADLND